LLPFRKILVCSLLLLGCGALCPAPAAAADWPAVAPAAAFVTEAATGQALYSMNGEKPLPPASTGKIITALLTLDMVDDLREQTTVSARAAAVEEMSLYLREGEVLTLEDLLKGALVHSGNDACYALAEAVAGSEPLFVHWLNMKAATLGAFSANLQNTNGLPAEGHSISAADLTMLAAAAMQHPFFAETVASKAVQLGEGSSYRYYKNTNKLLWQDEHIAGIKTGTTDAAGHCLIAAYRDGAALFISTVLHSPDRYGESLQLLRHAANTYALLCPVKAGQALATDPTDGSLLYAEQDVCFLVEEAAMHEVQVRWQLPYRVTFTDSAGDELGSTALTTRP